MKNIQNVIWSKLPCDISSNASAALVVLGDTAFSVVFDSEAV